MSVCEVMATVLIGLPTIHNRGLIVISELVLFSLRRYSEPWNSSEE